MTKRILLAEDGKETQAVVRQILVGEGFDVKAVGTGTDAVNALAHDLILKITSVNEGSLPIFPTLTL